MIQAPKLLTPTYINCYLAAVSCSFIPLTLAHTRSLAYSFSFDLLFALVADAGGLVVLGAVDVGAVGEGAVVAAVRPAPPLVLEVPVEAGEGAVLLALVLQEQRALLHAKLLQVSAMRNRREREDESVLKQREEGLLRGGGKIDCKAAETGPLSQAYAPRTNTCGSERSRKVMPF